MRKIKHVELIENTIKKMCRGSLMAGVELRDDETIRVRLDSTAKADGRKSSRPVNKQPFIYVVRPRSCVP